MLVYQRVICYIYIYITLFSHRSKAYRSKAKQGGDGLPSGNPISIEISSVIGGPSIYLVGGLEHFLFSNILGTIIQID